jgi:hypothetical protein
MLIWIAAVATRGGADRRVVMLLSFSVPIVLLIVAQSLVSRSHPSWTAAAAPAATILVTAWLIARERKVLFGSLLAVNGVATAAMLLGPVLPPSVFPTQSDPFARMRGWNEAGTIVGKKLAESDYRALAVDSRDLAAELLYYLRDTSIPLFIISDRETPSNHFEMTRLYDEHAPEPVLFVSLRQQPAGALKQFSSATFLGAQTAPGGGAYDRTLQFYELNGFRDRYRPRKASEER